MGDNLWEEDVLDEVRRAVEVHQPLTSNAGQTQTQEEEERARLGRRTLAGILSESLCSRAYRVSSTRPAEMGVGYVAEEDDLPFARRGRSGVGSAMVSLLCVFWMWFRLDVLTRRG